MSKAWDTRHANEAREVRELYQASFRSPGKAVGRNRGIRALVAAGGTVCLTLYGGGLDIDPVMQAGMSVIAVENGDFGYEHLGISRSRTRRALEWDAAERGFEAGWPSVTAYADKCDVAILDFCGGLGKENRDAIRACAHCKAVVVTLTTGHDIVTAAVAKDLSQEDRRVMFEALMHRTFACVRRIATYKSGKQVVWMYLLSHEPISIPRLSKKDAYTLRPELRAKANERQKTWNRLNYWKNLSAEKKRARLDASAECRRRRMLDPEYAAHRRQLDAEKSRRYHAAHRDDILLKNRAKRRAEAERHSES
jgi:hypothetical protein